jgi:threonine dehydrogenase-like Zn-dependent dehydrogenase
MKALIFTAPGKANFGEFDNPVIGSTECLVKPIQVGICHSDFDLLNGNYVLPVNYPIIPGHEWYGEVAEVGEDVTEFKVGDRVVGECNFADDVHFGFTLNGGLATEAKVQAAFMHKVPASLDDTTAAMIEPFTIAFAATDEIQDGTTVVVFGGGPIGLCSVVSAQAKGGTVILVEPDSNRRKLATQLGAAWTIDPLSEQVPDRIFDITNGAGADRVIEASGRPAVMAQTLSIARYGGYITNVGINVGDTVEAELGLIVARKLRIRGQAGSAGVWPEAIAFLENNSTRLSLIVSGVYPLEQAVEALDASEQRDKHTKIHVRPQD